MTRGMSVPSTPVANTDAEGKDEEDTRVAISANLKCSIVEVVGREDNRVGVVVANSDMVVGTMVSKEAS